MNAVTLKDGFDAAAALQLPTECREEFARMFAGITAKQEASEGICAEPYMGNIVAEDRPWPVVASLCDDIPLDPYRQLSTDEK